MDDHRPVQSADPDKQPNQHSSYSHNVATPAERLTEPSPPFRSSRVILDDGRAVGLTEPAASSDTHDGSVAPEPLGHRWSRLVSSFLRSSWGGVGVWLGAMTVVGLAAMMFSPTLAGFAGNPGPSNSDRTGQGGPGIVIADDVGAQAGDHRGSRARTTGELSDDSASSPPAADAPGRSSGSAGGLDLDLGHRSGVSAEDTAPVIASPEATPGETTPAPPPADPAAPSVGDVTEPVMSTTSTMWASSFPGSEPTTDQSTSANLVVENAAIDGDTTASIPSETTSLPELGTMPPYVTPPPHVTLPPYVTPPPHVTLPPSKPPTSASSRQSATETPPTSRKPVPADTRPSPGVGQGRGRGNAAADPGASASNGSNGANGKAVGRPH